MKKLNVSASDIAVLSEIDIMNVVGGVAGTLGCSRPCQTTCDSSNCITTTGDGGGCKPTSKGCRCSPEKDQKGID